MQKVSLRQSKESCLKVMTDYCGEHIEAMTDSSVLSPTGASGLGGAPSDFPIGHRTASR